MRRIDYPTEPLWTIGENIIIQDSDDIDTTYTYQGYDAEKGQVILAEVE